MIVGLYAVRDSATAVYDGPVPCATDGLAIRNFIDMAKNPNTAIGKNPEFFTLWRHGKWNDATGELTDEVNECLGTAVDFLTPDLSTNIPSTLNAVEDK